MENYKTICGCCHKLSCSSPSHPNYKTIAVEPKRTNYKTNLPQSSNYKTIWVTNPQLQDNSCKR
eukprot:8426900-Pyramimonas_sp.AAC.1